MKCCMAVCAAVLVWAAAAEGGSVEVYDWEAGTYKEYDVNRHGSNVEVYDWDAGAYKEYDVHRRGANVDVYDWSKGAYREYTISPGCRSIYDWQTGKDLELRPRGGDRFDLYDWQEHKYYDVRVKHR